MTDEKTKGPVSCFPSIKAKYGHPVQHWLDLIETRSALTHMQILGRLKDTLGLGHGHANALVAHALALKEGASL